MKLKVSSGFNLIELVITMAVVAALISLAAPSFQTLIANNRVSKISNEYVNAFRLARSTALSKGLITFVCPSANADAAVPACGVGTNWINGLLVFTKPAAAAVASPGVFVPGIDTLIFQSSFGNNISDNIVSGATATPGNFMGFLNNGFIWQNGNASNAAIALCDADRLEERGIIFLFSLAGKVTTRATVVGDSCTAPTPTP